jgi:thioesterase domain-containing protein/aryl carrier-like protein
VAARPATPRGVTFVDRARRVFAEVLGQAPAPDDNLLDLGLDSLRLAELSALLGRATGQTFRPDDLLAHPSLRQLADRAAAPLVTLRTAGTRVPIVCFHPAGGGIGAYARLRELLGDDQPLYAIRSRGLEDPEREHATLAAMAADYATLLPPGPVRLLGWSLGGLVAHAVAGLAGDRVTEVILLDPPEPGRVLDAAWLIVAGIAADLDPAAPVDRAGRPPAGVDLLAWSQAAGLIRPGAITAIAFAAAERLYRRHVALVAGHRPAVVRAPLRIFWASSPTVNAWSERTTGGLRERVVGGSHFEIVRPPSIDQIAAELLK